MRMRAAPCAAERHALAREIRRTDSLERGVYAKPVLCAISGRQIQSDETSPVDSSDPAVTDGALFAFADGTDPEVLLLLEARRGEGGDQWCFATARLNQLHVEVFQQERKVWEAPYLTRATWRNRSAPYAHLRQKRAEP